LAVGKSVWSTPARIQGCAGADPKDANAVVRYAQRAYIIGAAVGRQTSSSSMRRANRGILLHRGQAATSTGVRAALRQTLPGIAIEGVGDGVMLRAPVSSPNRGTAAGDMRAAGGGCRESCEIDRRSRSDQVMLRFNVSEVRRDIVKPARHRISPPA